MLNLRDYDLLNAILEQQRYELLLNNELKLADDINKIILDLKLQENRECELVK